MKKIITLLILITLLIVLNGTKVSAEESLSPFAEITKPSVTESEFVSDFYQDYLPCITEHYMNPQGRLPEEDCPTYVGDSIDNEYQFVMLCSDEIPGSIEIESTSSMDAEEVTVTVKEQFVNYDKVVTWKLSRGLNHWTLVELYCNQDLLKGGESE